ncbi:MAG: hypothetical protein HGA48_00270 [Candidatus Yonathbacteria bacterium]|nr:hypothetical protein [Candidatus Yonathbacteria bacterium]
MKQKERRKREMLPYEKALYENVPFGSFKYVSSTNSEHILSMKRHLMRKARMYKENVYIFANEKDPRWYDNILLDIQHTLDVCSVFLFVLIGKEEEVPQDIRNSIGKHEHGKIIRVSQNEQARSFIIVGKEGICYRSDEEKWTETKRVYHHYSCFLPGFEVNKHHSKDMHGSVTLNCSGEGEVIVFLSCIFLEESIAALLCSYHILP